MRDAASRMSILLLSVRVLLISVLTGQYQYHGRSGAPSRRSNDQSASPRVSIKSLMAHGFRTKRSLCLSRKQRHPCDRDSVDERLSDGRPDAAPAPASVPGAPAPGLPPALSGVPRIRNGLPDAVGGDPLARLPVDAVAAGSR